MAISQSFLDGLRAQNGMGMGNFTRPTRMRSMDQNNTISGNPGYAGNMAPQPLSWQQVAMQRQQQQNMLAQDPTNIRYINPQPTQQQYQQGAVDPNALAAQQQAGGAGMTGLSGMMGNNSPSGGIPQGLLQAMNAMRGNAGGGGFVQPRGYTPNQMAAGPSGFRFVRPMVR